jgi:hypothetical protein
MLTSTGIIAQEHHPFRWTLLPIPKKIWLAFVPTFGLVLAIVLFLFQARLDLLSLSAKLVATNTVFAILISLGVAFSFLAGFILLIGLLSKLWRRLLVRITLYTMARAVGGQSRAVHAIGIGPQRGNVVVRLAIGSSESVATGDRFVAVNAATRERLGVLEVEEAEADSCVCRVSDRINVEFWEGLEGRMSRDPSPPAGVTFSLEGAEEVLNTIKQLLRSWGG